MSDYLKSTNFATKDSLPSGNPGKIVKGTEIDNEFNAISDAIESKADLLNPVFSGLLTTDTLATTGAANIGGSLSTGGDFSGAGNATFSGTGKLLFPKGTTAQRPVSPVKGDTRYNTDLNYLENYDGTVWKAVGKPTPADVSDQTNTSTGYFHVPVGTDAQRTFSPINGLVRYNTTQNIYEGYVNGAWHRFQTFPQGIYSVSYLVVAGGGGGGTGAISGYSQAGGGGGAGGFYQGITTFTPGDVYTITVGAGGPRGTNGYNSSLSSVFTAIGGGAGANGPTSGNNNGASGGSGGGGSGGAGLGGNGTTGQGNAGSGSVASQAGGGGGAGTVGSVGTGGDGAVSSITGSSVTYAGGGGGGSQSTTGSGGSGGGGNSGTGSIGGSNGGTNLGGGGGGGGPFDALGASGGSGVVILSVPTASYTGVTTGSPVVSSSGSNTILKFTSSGTYTA